MDKYDFGEWYNCIASDNEKLLADKISEYEPLFDNMVFNTDDFEFCIPDEIRYFDITQFHFKVEDLPDKCGYYDHAEKVICIGTEYINDTPTILHEMIHLYEDYISEYRYLHDILYWQLYTGLREKVSRIDEIITEQATTINQVDIIRAGGTHDILFLLKSIELDLIMNYPIGTVFAYGSRER